MNMIASPSAGQPVAKTQPFTAPAGGSPQTSPQVDSDVKLWKKNKGVAEGAPLTDKQSKELLAHVWKSWCAKNGVDPNNATAEDMKAFSSYLFKSSNQFLVSVSKKIYSLASDVSTTLNSDGKKNPEVVLSLIAKIKELNGLGFSSPALDGLSSNLSLAIDKYNKTISSIPANDPQQQTKRNQALSQLRVDVATSKAAHLKPNDVAYKAQKAAIEFEQDYQLSLVVDFNQESDLKMWTDYGPKELVRKPNETLDEYRTRATKLLGLSEDALPKRLNGESDADYEKKLNQAIMTHAPTLTAKFVENLKSERAVVQAQLTRARERGDTGTVIYLEGRLKIIDQALAKFEKIDGSQPMAGIGQIGETTVGLMSSNLAALGYLRDKALARGDDKAAEALNQSILALTQTIAQVRLFFQDLSQKLGKAFEDAAKPV